MLDESTLRQANKLFLTKKYLDAIILYDQILKESPSNLDALNNKGYVLSKLKKYTEAILCYDAGLAIQPNEKTLLINKISSLRKIESYDTALHCCNQILKINPNDNTVLYHKERILLATENYLDAVQCCDRILSDYPENSEVLFDKAVALSKIGKDDEAISALRGAIRSDQKMKHRTKNHSAFLKYHTNQEFLRIVS
ncbi:MAG: tetratricopeptide repeat protein [Candidatus Nitrosotenuis sp.]